MENIKSDNIHKSKASVDNYNIFSHSNNLRTEQSHSAFINQQECTILQQNMLL